MNIIQKLKQLKFVSLASQIEDNLIYDIGEGLKKKLGDSFIVIRYTDKRMIKILHRDKKNVYMIPLVDNTFMVFDKDKQKLFSVENDLNSKNIASSISDVILENYENTKDSIQNNSNNILYKFEYPNYRENINLRKNILGSKVKARWVGTIPKIVTPYGTFSNISVAVNPTVKDIKTIVQETGSENIRVLATEDKQIYAWAADIQHERIIKYLGSKVGDKSYLKLEGYYDGSHLQLYHADISLKVKRRGWYWILEYLP